MATVTVSPASPRATIDACVVTVASADQNKTDAPVPGTYPVQAEKRYYIKFLEGSVEKGRSYVFGVDETGGHVFSSYIFPDPGTYVARLCDADGDGTVANSSNITVQ